MKVIQVFLEDAVHGDFKAWCAKKRISMQSQLSWWVINEACGGFGKPVAEVAVVARKQVKEESKLPGDDLVRVQPPKPAVNVVTPSGKYGKPIVDEDVVATMTCWKCKEKIRKWTFDSRGKPWCDSCIQDQKNAIA